MFDCKDYNGDWSGQLGYAEVDITPPVGIYFRNWGAAQFDNATGIHRPLIMQCLVFGDDSANQKIIITADLGWWKNNTDEQNLRHSIIKYFGLHTDQLLFCLSHTHAGPSICSSEEGFSGGEFIKPYLNLLFESALTCIESAKNNMFEANLNWSTGVCGLAKNRDIEVENSFLIGYNPKESGDQTMLVGKVMDHHGNLVLVICNYACHPTSFAHENRLISPDFVGATRELVERERNVPLVFLQGASGDLAPKKQYLSDPELVDANGRELGYAILSALETSDRSNTVWSLFESLISGAPLALWKEKLIESSREIVGREISVVVPFKKLETIEAIEEQLALCEDRVLKDRLRRKLNTRKSIGDQTLAHIPVWVWKIGNAVFVAQPNEAYSLYQQTVRQKFPNFKIIFINIANGYIGYLPPADLYENDMYAVWQTPYAKGSLELLIEETVKEIQTHLN